MKSLTKTLSLIIVICLVLLLTTGCVSNPVVDKCKNGHSWNDGEITKAATTEETGIKTYTCTVCQSTKKETIPKLEEEQPETQVKYYSNPVYAPVFADPCIVEHEGMYYAYATTDYGLWKPTDDSLDNLSNQAIVPILKSADLTKWYYAGKAFVGAKAPSWGTPGATPWAPDVVKIGDKFVMYYALSTWGDPDPAIGVATADHPLGPWTDQGKLFSSLEIGVDNSIDPAVFKAQDGKIYMIWGSFRGLFGVELSSDGLSLKGGIEQAKENKTLVAGIVGPWNGATYEAPYVIYENGYYYLFVSSGTCCEGKKSTYNVRVGRSTSPLGPYVDDTGASMCDANRGHIVVHGNDEFVGVGHNACVKVGDDWYIVYHGYDQKGNEKYGNTNARALIIDKLVWDNKGWCHTEGQVSGRDNLVAPIQG